MRTEQEKCILLAVPQQQYGNCCGEEEAHKPRATSCNNGHITLGFLNARAQPATTLIDAILSVQVVFLSAALAAGVRPRAEKIGGGHLVCVGTFPSLNSTLSPFLVFVPPRKMCILGETISVTLRCRMVHLALHASCVTPGAEVSGEAQSNRSTGKEGSIPYCCSRMADHFSCRGRGECSGRSAPCAVNHAPCATSNLRLEIAQQCCNKSSTVPPTLIGLSLAECRQRIRCFVCPSPALLASLTSERKKHPLQLVNH